MSLIAPPNRRRLILGLTGTFAVPLVARAESLMAIAPLDPFALGVASGEPWPDGFVIWTRLCYLNFPYNEEALPGPRHVGWEVAEDDTFTRIARRGSFRTDPRHAHAVHVELAGLKPDRPIGTASRRSGPAVRQAGPEPPPSRRPRPPTSSSPWPPALTGKQAISPPIGTWPPRARI